MSNEKLSGQGFYSEVLHTQAKQFLSKLDRVFDKRAPLFIGGAASVVSTVSPFEGLTVAVDVSREVSEDDSCYSLIMPTTKVSDPDTWSADGYDWASSCEKDASAWFHDVDEDDIDFGGMEVIDGGDLSETLEASRFSLEKETVLRFEVVDGFIFPVKSVNLNLYDEDDNAIESEVASHMLISNLPEKDDLNRDLKNLLLYGEVMLDVKRMEEDLCILTAADLIMSCSFLRGMGILNPHTKAFRGAPLDLPNFDYITAI